MKRASILLASACLLIGCDRSQSVSIDALAAEPLRLEALRAQCAQNRVAAGDAVCRRASEAFRRRFFAGEGGPDEYSTLADLPPIPATFDGPVPAEAGTESPSIANEDTQ